MKNLFLESKISYASYSHLVQQDRKVSALIFIYGHINMYVTLTQNVSDDVAFIVTLLPAHSMGVEFKVAGK